MKRKSILAASVVMLALVGCTADDDFVTESADGLISVTIPAGAGDSDEGAKASVGWDGSSNRLLWSENDAIGVFAGSGNVNRMFTLSSGKGTASGIFAGLMAPVPEPTTMILYYPYVSGISSSSMIPASDDLRNQVFEGTFEENGTFTNFGKYSFMFAKIKDFTIDTSWPAGKNASFVNLMSLVRFRISSSLPETLNIQKAGIMSADGTQTPFRLPYYYASTETGFSFNFYPSSDISTSISDRNKLSLSSGSTVYVQMAAMPNDFSDGQELTAYIEGINDDGRNFRYEVAKTVKSTNSFTYGKRTTISVPLTSGTDVSYACRVKVTTLDGASSLTAPVFSQGVGYSAASAWWGDGTVEGYEAGRTYKFASSGPHTASFNHWGGSATLMFDSLSGISAIDFSDVY